MTTLSRSKLIGLILVQARLASKSEASRFFLSYLWWILEPLLYVAVFYLVFSYLLQRGGADFLVFLLCGKIPYLWFSKSVIKSSESILQNQTLLNNVDIPKYVFPYMSIFEVLNKEWMVFAVLLLCLTILGVEPSWFWLWILPIALVQLLLIAACALIAALLIVVAQDFRIIIAMAMLATMFASGIFWDINDIVDDQRREVFLALNPLAFLFDAYRQVLMHKMMFNWLHMLSIAAVSLSLIGLSHVIYQRYSKAIAARVIAL